MKVTAMTETASMIRKYRDTYARVPRTGLIQKTFGLWMCLDAWRADGLPQDVDLNEFFQFDPPGQFELWQLGWCEAQFFPQFETKVLEERGETEIVQDHAGRRLLCFKGKRQGFMPEYVGHPVTDRKSFEEQVLWRMDPATPERLAAIDATLDAARQAEAAGMMISQRIIGCYMYLRSLMGPEEILYAFYDDPELIHRCLQGWFRLADAVTARYQQAVTFDEVFFAEDICYNHGPLISPEMIREFLFPYYQQLLANIRSRQRDRSRHLYVQLDTDGDCRPVIELYRDGIGCEVFSPLEVASGCDPVELGRKYPELVFQGGFDKRILAAGRDAIDREVDRIFPVMYERGGYVPTCDHGVPSEVNWRDYLHFRRRCLEFR